ncbi:cystathionine gamma-synthase family protein [Roseivirga sp.]|uniref:cystathionine gamma-synthase family protein n=1 Tax=Roseivirga sp. TaxID=1964215 RepID=UPI003B518E2F
MDDKKNFMQPESLMMSYGYKPELSEGAVKCPIFQTSTFVFKTAEEGKAFFEVAYGIREKQESEELGLIYSRLNNPDLEILENRLTLWDGAEDCAVFESGMSAITTVLLEFLNPGDCLLYSQPVYGGTSHFIEQIITRYGIHVIDFDASDSKADIQARVEAAGLSDQVTLVYVETPANPTNSLIDLVMCRELADEYSREDRPTLVAVDNTYMGPLWQHPLKHGADLVLYSATKYIGGHSDLIAGACLGAKDIMARVKGMRTFLGNMAGPWTGWLLMRSLETLKARMNIQEFNATRVAEFLLNHPKVEKVHYLGHIEDEEQKRIFDQQCEGTGAMVSFDIKGGEKEAFQFLNNLKLMKLAVSLGSTESLAEHPASMTHAGVPEEDRVKYKITPNLVRLSIGVENEKDIIWDISQALESVR